MKPKIQMIDYFNEKPILIFAQDDSESIVAGSDSTFYKKYYEDSARTFLSSLANQYDVRLMTFGTSCKESNQFTFSQKQTNIDNLFQKIENQFNASNVSDIIIASDGIFNTGKVKSNYNFKNAEIQSILLGDTSLTYDLSINRINTNKYAILNNYFPIEVVIQSNTYFEDVNVFLKEKDRVIDQKKINVNRGINKILFEQQAIKSGAHQYNVELTSALKERNSVNNKASTVVEVIDYNQNIVIISTCPHPDIGVIKEALNDIQGVKIKSFLENDFKENIIDYNLVCFYKPFSSKKLIKRIDDCQSNNIPTLIITGNNLDNMQNYFDRIALKKKTKFKGTNLVESHLVNDFKDFKIDKEWFNLWTTLPPLSVPFSANYSLKSNVSILLKQSINGVYLQDPLIYYHKIDGIKHGVVLGEGIWKWKMHQYQKTSSAEYVERFFQKVFQYLKKIDPKKRLNAIVPKITLEDEDLILSAEYYNENFEMDNSLELKLYFVDSLGNKYAKKMNKIDDNYQLILRDLKPGYYSYSMEFEGADLTFSDEGHFSIVKSKREWNNIVADHITMKTISGKSNSYFFRDLNKLGTKLIDSYDKKLITRQKMENKNLLEYKWLMFLLLIFPFLEWTIRKYNGLI